MRVIKIASIYFAIVFGVGFLLGMIRVPLVVPAVGERTAELIELPFMLASIIFAARWITQRYGMASDLFSAAAIGMLAAAFLLLVEFSVVLWLRGLSIREFLAQRDPVAGTLYYIAVGIFAAMPLLLSLGKRNHD